MWCNMFIRHQEGFDPTNRPAQGTVVSRERMRLPRGSNTMGQPSLQLRRWNYRGLVAA